MKMLIYKNRSLLTLCLCFLHLGLEAQIDTFHLRSIEVIEQSIERLGRPGVYTFDSTTYEQLGSGDAGNLLQSSTGIFVKDYGPGTISSLSYRGGTSYHTRIFWEGVSVDNSMLGQTDVSLIHLDRTSNTEFLKGGNSLSIGSGGISGILNIKPGSNKWTGTRVDVGAEIGSFNSYKEKLNLFVGNGRIKLEAELQNASSQNNYAYRDYLNQNELSYRQNADYNKFQLMPKLSVKLAKRHTLSLAYWYLLADRNVPSAIGSLDGGAYQSDVWNRSMLSWIYEGRKIKTELISSLMQDDLNYFNPQTSIISRSRISSSKSLYNVFWSLHKNISSDFQLKYDISAAESVNYISSPIQVNSGLSESIMYKNKVFYVNPAVRLDSWEKDFDVLPSVSAGVSPISDLDKLQIFITASMNVRRPTMNDLYYQNLGRSDLQSEHSKTMEVGTDYHLRLNNYEMSGTVTLYRNIIENLISWTPDQSGIYRPQNIRKVDNRGVELIWKNRYSHARWEALLNLVYNYTSSNVVENEVYPEFENHQQVYIPYHKLSFNFSIGWSGYFLSYNQVCMGKAFVNSNNTTWLPASFPANIELGKKMHLTNHLIIIKGGVSNLYNENYQYVANYPMPLVNYYISINYIFNRNQ